VNLICFTGEVAKMDRPRQRLRPILETLHHGPLSERHGTRRLKHRADLSSLGSAKVPKLELEQRYFGAGSLLRRTSIKQISENRLGFREPLKEFVFNLSPDPRRVSA
jgi:hypothetical protein